MLRLGITRTNHGTPFKINDTGLNVDLVFLIISDKLTYPCLTFMPCNSTKGLRLQISGTYHRKRA